MTPRIENIYPLSPVQQGILFHTLFAPGSRQYFQQFSYRLEGDLDAAVLERAWRRVVERHGVLRTAFAWQDLDEPVQVVLESVETRLGTLDWRGRPAAAQAGDLENLLRADRERGFDLTTAPLMRLHLVRLGEHAWQLIWSHHHLLLDGWSVPLVVGEITALYGALLAGGDPGLPARRPFSDYIAWLQDRAQPAAAAWWRSYLAGLDTPTPLAALLPRAPAAGAGADSVVQRRLTLSAAATAELRALGRRHQLTLNTLAQAAWGLLLACYARAGEALFGATVSGRPADLPGADTMIGMFINTLPVRVTADWRSPLVPWLRRLQAEQVELRRSEHTALVDIHGWSAIPRSLPLFETLLVFESFPRAAAAAGGAAGALRLSGPQAVERTNYPLTLKVGPGVELSLDLTCQGEPLEPATLVRLLRQLACLLHGLAGGEHGTVGDLGLLSSAERHQLTREWNDTRAAFAARACLHQIIAARAATAAAAPAVCQDGRTLAYAELAERARQLAERLRRLGVGPEVRVGLWMERSPEMVVALLGILEAGGAYVPLDPLYPRERVAFILEDARVAAVVTSTDLAPRLPATGLRTICLDADGAHGAGGEHGADRTDGVDPADPADDADDADDAESNGAAPEGAAGGDHAHFPAATGARRPVIAAAADNLAYLLYTSGSTGRPKGVEITHRSLVNFLAAMARRPGFDAAGRLLAVTSLSFDIAALEIFLPLTQGGTVVLASAEEAGDAERLGGRLRQARATAMQATPATWRMLVEAGWPGDAALDCLCGGEALHAPLAAELSRRVHRLWNLYGPTETTVWSAVARLEPDQDGAPPIGRPIANTEIYLLDPRLELVPARAAGELLIGGAGLARGYRGLPALTAARFIPHPFAAEPGARLYRTGDLARLRADGSIEFLGRLDDQIKVRGFRVEPREIEAALGAVAGVGEAAVLLHEAAPGDQRLVAFVAAAPGATLPEESELRQSLRGLLPAYMVPASYLTLPALPQTPNGKLDRAALRRLAAAPMSTTGMTHEPRAGSSPDSPTERTLAAIWSEVLHRDGIGPQDSFFDLGGHSLLAIQIVSRVGHRLAVELPIRSLFDHPTLAALAAEIDRRAAAGAAEGGAGSAPPAPEAGLAGAAGDVDAMSDEEVAALLAELAPARDGG